MGNYVDNVMNEGKANRKRKGGLSLFVLIVSIVVFVGSLTALGVIGFSYLQGHMKYDRIAQESGLDTASLDDPLTQAHVNWDQLKAANPDTVAWVYIPNTSVNYPVVQGTDNDFYLHHDFDGDQGWLAETGAVFLDAGNAPDFSDASNFIYGHHLQDGSMFAPLGKIGDQQRFEECRTVYLLTPQGNYKLRAYSLVHTTGIDPIVELSFATKEDMAKYVQDKIDRSVYDPGDIPEASRIRTSIAFSTCDDTYQSWGRFVMFCYIEDTTAEGLSGDIGISTDEEGQTVGFDNGLGTS